MSFDWFHMLLHVAFAWFFVQSNSADPDAPIDSTCRRNSGSKLCKLDMHRLWVFNSNRQGGLFVPPSHIENAENAKSIQMRDHDDHDQSQVVSFLDVTVTHMSETTQGVCKDHLR